LLRASKERQQDLQETPCRIHREKPEAMEKHEAETLEAPCACSALAASHRK
jgi:hypothetical protein